MPNFAPDAFFTALSQRRPSAMRWILLAVLCLQGCASTPQTSQNDASAPRSSNQLAQVQTELGMSYMGRGDYEQAWQRLNNALKLDPSFSTAHLGMALLHEQLKEPEKAEGFYRRAVELDPQNASAQTNYGGYLCRVGRYEDGEKHSLLALENSLYERPEIAYTNAGLCALKGDHHDRAENYFREALKKNERIPGALIGMTELSYAKKKHLSARAYLERYLQIGKADARSLYLGANIERELGDIQASSDYADRLKSEFPTSEEADELTKAKT